MDRDHKPEARRRGRPQAAMLALALVAGGVAAETVVPAAVDAAKSVLSHDHDAGGQEQQKPAFNYTKEQRETMRQTMDEKRRLMVAYGLSVGAKPVGPAVIIGDEQKYSLLISESMGVTLTAVEDGTPLPEHRLVSLTLRNGISDNIPAQIEEVYRLPSAGGSNPKAAVERFTVTKYTPKGVDSYIEYGYIGSGAIDKDTAQHGQVSPPDALRMLYNVGLPGENTGPWASSSPGVIVVK